jgi:S-adenosylmethionine decarboxylase
MDSHGKHVLLECRGCERAVLDDASALERALRAAAERIGARVITAAFHAFAPHGVTGMLLLEESHISVHSWPEHGYAAIDLFTCGTADPAQALPLLREALGARELAFVTVERGLGTPALRVGPVRSALLQDGRGPVVDLGLGHGAAGEPCVEVAAFADVDQELRAR